MGKALYRKYRSKSLADVVGQKHITDTLQRALEQDRISHAYLFTGPRGVGKTSIARILAHQINKLTYNSDVSHIDIIEIDAASNRRIDEIRDLRDKVHIAPAMAPYKVYIIDEVHMLTKEAFNALLKTLEEPPAHAVFILATTDLHKLPETIISRCIHFHFKTIGEVDIVKHLQAISQAENINITEDALKLIAAHGDGSFRDSISLLDQSAALADNIAKEDIEHLLGVVPDHLMQKLYQDITSANPRQILASIQTLIEQGLPVANITKQLANQVRVALADEDGISIQNKIKLLDSLLRVSSSSEPRIALEIAVLSAVDLHNNSDKLPPSKQQPVAAKHAVAKEASKPKPSPSANSTQEATPLVTNKKQTQKTNNKETSKLVQETTDKSIEKTPVTNTVELPPVAHTAESWNKILTLVRKRHNTLYSILRMARATVESDTLSLTFAFAFHQKRLDEPKNKQIIAKIASEVYETPIHIECLVDPKLKDTQTQPTPLIVNNKNERVSEPSIKPENESIKNISDIFGGGEVLE